MRNLGIRKGTTAAWDVGNKRFGKDRSLAYFIARVTDKLIKIVLEPAYDDVMLIAAAFNKMGFQV